MEMIKTVDLHKSFGQLQLLKGVSETIRKGEVVSIIGPSGGGKSTFLRCLNLLEKPERGQIFFEGKQITGKHVDIDLHRQKMGMVFQQFNVFPHLSVCDNVTLAPKLLKKKTDAEATDMAKELLSRVGLIDKLDEMPGNLSGGQKQRLAIARMLTRETPIMIFDDSLSAVDTQTDAKIRAAISQRFGKASVILISHRITTLSAADKILVMDQGRIVEEGTHEELKCAGGIYQKIYETQTGIREEVV